MSIRKRQANGEFSRAQKRRKYNPNNTVANYNRAFSTGLVPTYRGFSARAFSKGEWKYVDVTATSTMDNTTSVNLLNGIAGGTTASTRIGTKVSIMSLEFRGYAYVTPATGVDQVQRFMIVRDGQTNATALTCAQVLQGSNVFAPRNLENRKRFKILMDKAYTLNATAEPGSRRFFKFYMKFRRPIIVDYNLNVAGTVGDIVTNSIYFVALGTEAAGVGAGGMTYWSRIRYVDN